MTYRPLTDNLVLTDDLVAYSENKQLPKPYRAVLQYMLFFTKPPKPMITVEQPIGDKWYPTGGSWYLSALMENPEDGIVIDGIQQWEIREGFLNAIRKAQEIAAQEIAGTN